MTITEVRESQMKIKKRTHTFNGVWWRIPGIPALWEEDHEFKHSLRYLGT